MSFLLGVITGAVGITVLAHHMATTAVERRTTAAIAERTTVPADALAAGTVVTNVVTGRGGRVVMAGLWGQPGEQVRVRYVVQWHDGEVSSSWAESLRQIV